MGILLALPLAFLGGGVGALRTLRGGVGGLLVSHSEEAEPVKFSPEDFPNRVEFSFAKVEAWLSLEGDAVRSLHFECGR